MRSGFFSAVADAIFDGGTISGDLVVDGDLTVNGNSTGAYDELVSGNLAIGSEDKLFLDGGGDTYIQEDSANNILFNSSTATFSGTVTADGFATTGNISGNITATQLNVEATGDLRLEDTTGGEYVALQAPGTVTSYTVTMPGAVGSSGQALRSSDGSGTLEWYTPEEGDITSVVAGTGLSGGGTAGAVTLNLDGVTVDLFAGSAIQVSGESFADNDTSVMTSAAIANKIEAYGYTTEVGDITSVVAGTGLSGGGSSGDVTLNLDGVTVALFEADAVQLSSESFSDDNTSLMTSAAIADKIEAYGYTTEVGDITSVVAGTGLSGGGASGDVTLTVSGLTLSELAGSSVIIESEGIGNNDNDTTLATSAAIIDYVANEISSSPTALSGMTDASITSPADASLLLYDTGTSKWRDGAMSGDATIGDTGAITLTSTNTNLTTLANVTTVGAIASGSWEATDVAVAHGGTGASTAGDARTNLEVAVGSDVQAYHATLDTVSDGTYAGDDNIVTVGTIATGTWEGDTVAVAQGGTGATSLNNLITLTTHTTGDYVGTITGGAGIDSDAATSGEGTTHTLSLDLNELATETSIADEDFIVMVDATDDGSGKITFENLEDSIFSSVSGDILITEAGVSSIQSNSVALSTDTTGDYVSTITGGTGVTSSGNTSGEGIAHSLSVDASQTQVTAVGALDAGTITSGFGSIDSGSSAITTTGLISGGDLAITGSSTTIGTVTSGVWNAGAVTSSGLISGVTGDFSGDLTVDGDLLVSGDSVTVNTANITVEDPLIKLASGNDSADSVDIGFYGLCDPSGSQDTYTGLVRDASDAKYHLFDLLQAEPTTTMNISGTGFDHADLHAGVITADDGFTGDLTGNADTVTTNANLTGHVTSSGNAAVLGSFTVAQLSTALSDASISGNNTGDQTLPTDFVSAASGGTFGGSVTATGSFIIGDADMNEADLEKLDGITDGAGAANKALVLDGSADVASGLRNMTLSGIADAVNYKVSGAQGSDGQVLTSTGAGVAWEALPAGGVEGLNSSANATWLTVDSSENSLFAGVVTASGFTIGDAAITEAEFEILDGATVTTSELNILDGVTSTAAELNILDGVTSTAAELNILDGVTSTASELNILDGVTASTAEINLLDGLTTLSGSNTGDQTLPTDFVSKASGGTFTGNVIIDKSGDGQTPLVIDTGNNEPLHFYNDSEQWNIKSAEALRLTSNGQYTGGIYIDGNAGDCTFGGNIYGSGSSLLLKSGSNDNAFIGLYDDKSISIYTDNVERMRFGTTNANFGTGINTLIYGDGTTNTFFYIDSGNSSSGYIRFRDATNDTRCGIQADLQGDNNAYGDLSFMTGGNVLALNLDRDQNAEFAGTITNAPSTDGAYAMFINQQHATGWGLRIAGGADSGDNLINAQNGSGTEKFVVKSDGSATFADTVTATRYRTGSDGNVNTPAYAFNNSTNTGIYAGTTNRISFTNNGYKSFELLANGNAQFEQDIALQDGKSFWLDGIDEDLELRAYAGNRFQFKHDNSTICEIGADGVESQVKGNFNHGMRVGTQSANESGYDGALYVTSHSSDFAIMVQTWSNLYGILVNCENETTHALAVYNDDANAYKFIVDQAGAVNCGAIDATGLELNGNNITNAGQATFGGTTTGYRFKTGNDGNNSTPAYAFQNSTNTGMYAGGTNCVTFTNNGSKSFEIKADQTAQFEENVHFQEDIKLYSGRSLYFNDPWNTLELKESGSSLKLLKSSSEIMSMGEDGIEAYKKGLFTRGMQIQTDGASQSGQDGALYVMGHASNWQIYVENRWNRPYGIKVHCENETTHAFSVYNDDSNAYEFNVDAYGTVDLHNIKIDGNTDDGKFLRSEGSAGVSWQSAGVSNLINNSNATFLTVGSDETCQFHHNIYPVSDDTYACGTGSKKWQWVYTNGIKGSSVFDFEDISRINCNGAYLHGDTNNQEGQIENWEFCGIAGQVKSGGGSTDGTLVSDRGDSGVSWIDAQLNVYSDGDCKVNFHRDWQAGDVYLNMSDDSSSSTSKNYCWIRVTGGSSTNIMEMKVGGNVNTQFKTYSTQIMKPLECDSTVTCTSLTETSDLRIKDNIEQLTGALNTISSLRGITYTNKDTNKDSIGVIAQEVEEILPELVGEDTSGMANVRYTGLVPVLIEAIKELKNEVDALKHELN